MGTGSHGGFGNTYGSRSSKLFKIVNYVGTVKVDGKIKDVSRRVYQRNDIDFEYIDSVSGKSNIDRMRAGQAPIGNDGRPIQLHHIIQKEPGTLVEIREVTHQEYMHTLHGLGIHGASFRNNPELLSQYNNFRRSYWRWRAKKYLENGGRSE